MSRREIQPRFKVGDYVEPIDGTNRFDPFVITHVSTAEDSPYLWRYYGNGEAKNEEELRLCLKDLPENALKQIQRAPYDQGTYNPEEE